MRSRDPSRARGGTAWLGRCGWAATSTRASARSRARHPPAAPRRWRRSRPRRGHIPEVGRDRRHAVVRPRTSPGLAAGPRSGRRAPERLTAGRESRTAGVRAAAPSLEAAWSPTWTGSTSTSRPRGRPGAAPRGRGRAGWAGGYTSSSAWSAATRRGRGDRRARRWPRRLAAEGAEGDESEAAVSRTGRRSRTRRPARDLARSEIRVASLRDGRGARSTGTRGRATGARWSPDGATIAYASSAAGSTNCTRRPRRWSDGGLPPRTWTTATRTGTGGRSHPRDPDAARATDSWVDARTGETEVLAPGGQWSGAHLTAGGGVSRATRTTARRRAARRRPAAHAHDPRAAPRPVRGAPHAALRRSPTAPRRAEIDAFLVRRRALGPAPARRRCRHGGPIDFAGDLGTARRVLRREGLRLAGAELPRLGELRARFENVSHGGGVGDTQDCLAAADRRRRSTGRAATESHLRASDGLHGDRRGADDRVERFRCAACKYATATWLRHGRRATLRRAGARDDDADRPPRLRPTAWRRVPPLEGVRVPVLVATGELDRRASRSSPPSSSRSFCGSARRSST